MEFVPRKLGVLIGALIGTQSTLVLTSLIFLFFYYFYCLVVWYALLLIVSDNALMHKSGFRTY